MDIVIIGAGPSGLACAIEATKRGLTNVVLEKGCITNSVFHFPPQVGPCVEPETGRIRALVSRAIQVVQPIRQPAECVRVHCRGLARLQAAEAFGAISHLLRIRKVEGTHKVKLVRPFRLFQS